MERILLLEEQLRKTAYGLSRVIVQLQETACCVIRVALLFQNFIRPLKAALCVFASWLPQLFCRDCGAGPD